MSLIVPDNKEILCVVQSEEGAVFTFYADGIYMCKNIHGHITTVDSLWRIHQGCLEFAHEKTISFKQFTTIDPKDAANLIEGEIALRKLLEE